MSSILKLNFSDVQKPKTYEAEKEVKLRVKDVKMNQSKKGLEMPTLICVDTQNPEFSPCFERLVFPSAEHSPEAQNFMLLKILSSIEGITGENLEGQNVEFDFSKLVDREFWAVAGPAKDENGQIFGNEIKKYIRPA